MCVADDPQADKLLLVMEYAEAGPVMRGDRSTEKVPLAEGVALKFFRDVLQVCPPQPFAECAKDTFVGQVQFLEAKWACKRCAQLDNTRQLECVGCVRSSHSFCKEKPLVD